MVSSFGEDVNVVTLMAEASLCHNYHGNTMVTEIVVVCLYVCKCLVCYIKELHLMDQLIEEEVNITLIMDYTC